LSIKFQPLDDRAFSRILGDDHCSVFQTRSRSPIRLATVAHRIAGFIIINQFINEHSFPDSIAIPVSDDMPPYSWSLVTRLLASMNGPSPGEQLARSANASKNLSGARRRKSLQR
jgi:hypothetical protein